jgi:hypothetical protein
MTHFYLDIVGLLGMITAYVFFKSAKRSLSPEFKTKFHEARMTAPLQKQIIVIILVLAVGYWVLMQSGKSVTLYLQILIAALLGLFVIKYVLFVRYLKKLNFPETFVKKAGIAYVFFGIALAILAINSQYFRAFIPGA